MLREATVHTDWCDMTMSVMREKQFEACERRLLAYSGVSLFSSEATDADAQELYRRSYDHRQGEKLVTISSLRGKVLRRLRLEARYISADERRLLESLLINDGELVLDDWDNIGSAEALVRRLWCGLNVEGDVSTLVLPRRLQLPLTKALYQEGAEEALELCCRFDASINGLLYISGMLHSAQPLACFMREVMKREDAFAAEVGRRYLMSSFEYIDITSGELILLHPGLADPCRLLGTRIPEDRFTVEMAQEMMLGGMKGIMPEEEPLNERMCGALMGALRPDYDVFECAEDLRMLAKQGVPYGEVESVLCSMLAVMPTDYMLSALRALYLNTPRWMSLKAAVAN